LFQTGAKEGESFAESSRTGEELARLRATFEQKWHVQALNIPAALTSKLQQETKLKPHILKLPRIRSLVFDSADKSRREILLNVENIKDLPATVQEFLKQLESTGDAKMVQSALRIGYEYWSTEDVLSALLPEGLPEGTPTSFTTTGHIAHVNLRDEYLPYRFIIGQVLLEKNSPVIKTVVNKLDTIDTKFRFFEMELLAGEPLYTVTVSESNCRFTFDFRQVYWNSRLHTEHARLVELFQPYDVICDVMAGVGPFAVPAAKKGCYVLANDLNPASYESLALNSKRNHVETRLWASCVDGAQYIRDSVIRCWNDPLPGIPSDESARSTELNISSRQRAKEAHERSQRNHAVDANGIARGPGRRLIDHFVMNLPATALEFLGAYRGAYRPIASAELEAELTRRKDEEGADRQWPMVHVHCFTKDLEQPYVDICERANKYLGLDPQRPDRLVPPAYLPQGKATAKQDASPEGASKPTPDLSIHLVRSVAPNKDMYCLSFRLTRDILFAED
jgi:tRNA (guanine37-N1)-methyltransferase